MSGSSIWPLCGQPCLAASESYKDCNHLVGWRANVGACAVSWARELGSVARNRDVRNRTRSCWPLANREGDFRRPRPLNCLLGPSLCRAPTCPLLNRARASLFLFFSLFLSFFFIIFFLSFFLSFFPFRGFFFHCPVPDERLLTLWMTGEWVGVNL